MKPIKAWAVHHPKQVPVFDDIVGTLDEARDRLSILRFADGMRPKLMELIIREVPEVPKKVKR
jgi:hypothetical protein